METSKLLGTGPFDAPLRACSNRIPYERPEGARIRLRIRPFSRIGNGIRNTSGTVRFWEGFSIRMVVSYTRV